MLLKIENLHKSVAGESIFEGISLKIEKGKFHVLSGSEEAQCFALVRILAGIESFESGKIWLNGKRFRPGNALKSRKAGIALVLKNPVFVPHFSVYKNMVLGMETSFFGIEIPIRGRVRKVLKMVGLNDLRLDSKLVNLHPSIQMRLSFARALLFYPKLVLLESIFERLSLPEIKQLKLLIADLQQQGISFLYAGSLINLQEIASNGYAYFEATKLLHFDDLHALETYLKAQNTRDSPQIKEENENVKLEKIQLNLKQLSYNALIRRASFSLAKGEILGIYSASGLEGAALLRYIFGIEKAHSLEMEWLENDRTFLIQKPKSCSEMKRLGFRFLSNSSSESTLFPSLDLKEFILVENSFSGSFLLSKSKLKSAEQEAKDFMQNISINSASAKNSIKASQQQWIFAQTIADKNTRLLLCHDVLNGLNPSEISQRISHLKSFAANGNSIVFASKNLEDMAMLCQTVAIFHQGELLEKRPLAGMTKEKMELLAMAGFTS